MAGMNDVEGAVTHDDFLFPWPRPDQGAQLIYRLNLTLILQNALFIHHDASRDNVENHDRVA